MTRDRKEEGGTVGLEQAAMVGWSSAGRGACVAGEGRQEGGEADHDERVEGWRGGGDGMWLLGLRVCVEKGDAR